MLLIGMIFVVFLKAWNNAVHIKNNQMTTQEQIQKISEDTNISKTDLMFFIKGIINSIIADGMDKILLNSDKETQNNAVAAYLDNEIKKYNKFVTKYQTNEEFKDNFRKYVYKLLTN